jgi:hypothetical protein
LDVLRNLDDFRILLSRVTMGGQWKA